MVFWRLAYSLSLPPPGRRRPRVRFPSRYGLFLPGPGAPLRSLFCVTILRPFLLSSVPQALQFCCLLSPSAFFRYARPLTGVGVLLAPSSPLAASSARASNHLLCAFSSERKTGLLTFWGLYIFLLDFVCIRGSACSVTTLGLRVGNFFFACFVRLCFLHPPYRSSLLCGLLIHAQSSPFLALTSSGFPCASFLCEPVSFLLRSWIFYLYFARSFVFLSPPAALSTRPLSLFPLSLAPLEILF